MRRPTSLTVVAWLLILGGALALLSTVASYADLYARYSPSCYLSPHLLMPWAMIAFLVIVAVVNIAAGLAILMGREWSRTVYIGVSVLGLSVAYADLPPMVLNNFPGVPMVLLPFVLIFALFVYLLYQPAAAEYFGRPHPLQRPVSLTIVAWFLIVSGTLNTIRMLSPSKFRPLSDAQDVIAMAAVGIPFVIIPMLVKFVISIAILRKREWSRKGLRGDDCAHLRFLVPGHGALPRQAADDEDPYPRHPGLCAVCLSALSARGDELLPAGLPFHRVRSPLSDVVERREGVIFCAMGVSDDECGFKSPIARHASQRGQPLRP